MKTQKRILLLTALVTAIVIFWLVPGINTARETKYTRVYENTDAPVAIVNDSVPQKGSVPVTAERQKKYKTESIEKDASLGDIKASMFSRALHFEEELAIHELLAEDELFTENDSVHEVKITMLDSIQVAATDTVAMLQQ